MFDRVDAPLDGDIDPYERFHIWGTTDNFRVSIIDIIGFNYKLLCLISLEVNSE